MQMKTLIRVAVAIPLAGALLLSQPAQAASYTFTAGTGSVASATRTAFVSTKCDPEGPAKQMNGTDARFVSVSGMAGKHVRVTWRADVAGATFRVSLYSGNCDYVISGSTQAFGTFTTAIPANVRWLVAEAFYTANISFELTPI